MNEGAARSLALCHTLRAHALVTPLHRVLMPRIQKQKSQNEISAHPSEPYKGFIVRHTRAPLHCMHIGAEIVLREKKLSSVLEKAAARDLKYRLYAPPTKCLFEISTAFGARKISAQFHIFNFVFRYWCALLLKRKNLKKATQRKYSFSEMEVHFVVLIYTFYSKKIRIFARETIYINFVFSPFNITQK